MKRTIFTIIAALLAVSCVYEFEPEGVVTQKRLVIEGDIIVGGTTKVIVSCTMPLRYDEDYDYSVPSGTAWVEAQDGSIFTAKRTVTSGSQLQFTIDTRDAQNNTRYRLHFMENGSSREYISSWQEVIPAPEIKGMSFDFDDSKVYLRVSADGKDTAYFKWDYVEDWEFHAEYAPLFMFDVEKGQCIQLDEYDYSTYYCWNHHESSQSGLVSTAAQSMNVMDGQLVESYERKNIRFQYLYRMDLTMTGLSSDAYEYLHNMREISNVTGSLFAPSPDDMRGNIKCQQDTTEFVIGYISALQPVTERFYIKEGENAFYKAPVSTPIVAPELEKDQTLTDYYYAGHRPVFEEYEGISAVIKWGPTRCVDCTMLGGYKTRPHDWPNNHE